MVFWFCSFPFLVTHSIGQAVKQANEEEKGETFTRDTRVIQK